MKYVYTELGREYAYPVYVERMGVYVEADAPHARVNVTHRPWPADPQLYPLSGPSSGATYAPRSKQSWGEWDLPIGPQVFRASEFTRKPKRLQHPPMCRYYGFIWLGIAFVWWPVSR